MPDKASTAADGKPATHILKLLFAWLFATGTDADKLEQQSW